MMSTSANNKFKLFLKNSISLNEDGFVSSIKHITENIYAFVYIQDNSQFVQFYDNKRQRLIHSTIKRYEHINTDFTITRKLLPNRYNIPIFFI